MKSAIAVFVFSIVGVPLFGQDVPPEVVPPDERGTVLSVGGADAWPIGINGQAVGWSMDRAHSRVDIAAHLGNGGGHAYVDAYLMRDIGPDATVEDEMGFSSR